MNILNNLFYKELYNLNRTILQNFEAFKELKSKSYPLLVNDLDQFMIWSYDNSLEAFECIENHYNILKANTEKQALAEAIPATTAPARKPFKM